MRTRILTALALLVSTTLLTAQDPPPQAPEPLPVKRVVLYKAGVGYFEHVGTVRGTQDITIRFTSAQLNDVLKSLTAIDLGKGQISGISYNSVAPIERRLGALRLPVNQQTTMMDLLASLRGARIEVAGAAGPITGRLLSVEQRAESRDGKTVSVQMISLMTDGGEIRTFEITPAVKIRLLERDLRQEVGRYLDVVGSAREQDVRSMVISATGTGDRQLFVSYVSEVPIWKSTYRLVVPASGKPFLQGWAVVDNTIGEDWRNVELSLVAGAPQSFIQQLSQPYYGQRPVVPLPKSVLLAPQTHGATLVQGEGTVSGTVRDTAGGSIPGATVRLIGAAGDVASVTTDSDGDFEISAPAGVYSLRVQLQGFGTAVITGVGVQPGGDVTQDVQLAVGALSETVTVQSQSATVTTMSAASIGYAPPAPPAPRMDAVAAYEQMKDAQAAAAGAELGELFEYRIKQPVTLHKNQSALVPIVNAEIAAEKVSLWNRSMTSGRPYRAMWLTNTSGLTLDGGSITVIEGEAFAGEGLIEPLKPGEKRLVSYAADLGILVHATTEGSPQRTFKLRARDGILIQETEDRAKWTYTARNEGAAPATLIIEHTLRPGWKLSDGQAPAESARGAERFRVLVPAGKEATLAVQELRPGMTQIQIGDITQDVIVRMAATGIDADALLRALKPVLDKKTELAAIERRLRDFETQRNRIVQDQNRVRENMKALRGSSEERQLLQRYTRQLDEQENTLITLQREIDKATEEHAAASEQLRKLIGSMSFELTAAR